MIFDENLKDIVSPKQNHPIQKNDYWMWRVGFVISINTNHLKAFVDFRLKCCEDWVIDWFSFGILPRAFGLKYYIPKKAGHIWSTEHYNGLSSQKLAKYSAFEKRIERFEDPKTGWKSKMAINLEQTLFTRKCFCLSYSNQVTSCSLNRKVGVLCGSSVCQVFLAVSGHKQSICSVLLWWKYLFKNSETYFWLHAEIVHNH